MQEKLDGGPETEGKIMKGTVHLLRTCRAISGACFFLCFPALCAAANLYPVDLALVPPGASNRIDLEISGTILGSTDSDSDSGNVTGNIEVLIGAVIDGQTMEVENIETLEFTGGRVALQDMSYGLSWFLIGSLDVDSRSIAGTFDTPDPPKPVTGGTFNAADHLMVLNEGNFNASGSGLLGGFLPQNPYVLSLSDEPLSVQTEATGSLTVSSPTIEGDLAWYDVTLRLPVEIEEVVFEEPGTAEVTARGTATLEASGRFSQSLPDFGAVVPPISTGLEEAAAGSTSFARRGGETELEWTMEARRVTVQAGVADTFVDPDDPANLQQFHLNNADVLILTEPIDVRGEDDLRASIDLRTWDTSSGFEMDDYLQLKFLLSSDGINFDEELSWISLVGSQLTALNRGSNGAFTTYRTPAGFLPAGTKSMRISLEIVNNSPNEHVFWDNLRIDIVDGADFIRGDCNGDGETDISDAICILFFKFKGSAISCEDAADLNDDGVADITDVIHLLGHLFLDGPAPGKPYPGCGPDPMPDGLACQEFEACGEQ